MRWLPGSRSHLSENDDMTTTITIANQKGGVGKTTTAVTLAHGLVRAGKRVLLADLDPQGQCATILGLKPEPGAYRLLTTDAALTQVIRLTDRPNLLVLLGDRKTAAAQTLLAVNRSPIQFIRRKLVEPAEKESLDYIIIDTSPSIGELQEQALWAADGVLIPCAADYLATDGVFNIAVTLKRLHEEFRWRGAIIGVLPTFYDTVTRESRATLKDLNQRFAGLMLEPINRATLLRECAVEGKTIFELGASSRAARQYEAVIQRVLDWKEKQ